MSFVYTKLKSLYTQNLELRKNGPAQRVKYNVNNYQFLLLFLENSNSNECSLRSSPHEGYLSERTKTKRGEGSLELIARIGETREGWERYSMAPNSRRHATQL